MGAHPRPGPQAFGAPGKSAREFLDRVGDELRRADEVLIKLKRGRRGSAPAPPSRCDAPNADEFLRQLDRAALRLKPDAGPGGATAFPLYGPAREAVEHSPPEPAWGRERGGGATSPLTWTAAPISSPTRGCSTAGEDLSSLLLCEDCRRLGVRLLRVAADVAPREPVALPPAPREVSSSMVDRLRDMAAAVGEMQVALGGGEGRLRQRSPPRLKLTRFSES